MGMEIDYNKDKGTKKKGKADSRLQSVNPAKSGLAIPTVWNAMDSQEWVESD